MAYELFFPHQGGIESHIYYLSQSLAKRGHETEVVTSALPGQPAQERMGGISVRRIEMLGLLDRTARYGITRLARQLAWSAALFANSAGMRGRYDVMHAHLEPSLLGLSYGKPAHGTPVVWTLHGTYYEVWPELVGPLKGNVLRLQQRLNTLLCPWDHMITADEYSRRLAIKWGVDPGRVTAIPNAIDAGIFRPMDVGAHERFTVLAARRLVKKNGVEYFIDAAKLLKGEGIEFQIVGTGPLEKQLRARAAGLGNVRFLGNIENQKMPGYYNAADVVCLPSLAEATSISGLEGMACGKPLVSTDAGGLPETNVNGKTGLIVPMRSPRALADAILFLKDNEAERLRMGRDARRHVEDNFVWDVTVKKVEEVYKKVA